METYLVTGFSGFVSKHFLNFLDDHKISAFVQGIDINPPDFDIHCFKFIKCDFEQVDLLNKKEVDVIVRKCQPNYILHLASYSSVAFSWNNPVKSFANNTNIFLNLLEVTREMNLKCRILSVGSSEEYGNVVESDMPLKEEHSLNPISPYAVARVSQELLSRVYVDGFGLDIIMTRSFNHIGPGQNDLFVISSFAKQLVNLEKTNEERELITGDTSIIRDFVDVRDVVHAYYLLFKKGEKGQVYNICSGEGISLNDVIHKLAKILNLQITNRVDKKLLRPNENMVIIGSNAKIRKLVQWDKMISLEQSLTDIISYWKSK